MPTITIDAPTLERLILAYKRACKDGKPSFIFEGHEFLTLYAYYFLLNFCPKFGVKFEESSP